MLRRTNRLWMIVAIAAMVATGGVLVNAAAQKASVPKPQDNLALGEDEVKKLLLIMEPDKKGKISKQEYMKFMEAEFERLDKDKNGELDVKKLTQSSVTANRYVGK
jgi:Ca2+-binding EF-hand superfamily protein